MCCKWFTHNCAWASRTYMLETVCHAVMRLFKISKLCFSMQLLLLLLMFAAVSPYRHSVHRYIVGLVFKVVSSRWDVWWAEIICIYGINYIGPRPASRFGLCIFSYTLKNALLQRWGFVVRKGPRFPFTFIQGDSYMRNQKLLCVFSHKLVSWCG